MQMFYINSGVLQGFSDETNVLLPYSSPPVVVYIGNTISLTQCDLSFFLLPS